MGTYIAKLKDKLYDACVKKNGRVWYEYERYIREHIAEHKTHRLKHIFVLIKLNWFYRIKKGNTPYLYRDTPLEPVKKKENTNSQNMPCLKFAESSSEKKISPTDLIKTLITYDVISFDVFDTLIFRPFSKPRDLFWIIGGKLNCLGFKQIRCEAEDFLRKKYMDSNINHELTLQEIYTEINYRTGIDAIEGMQLEIATELDLCFANPYMQYVFDTLKGNGKRIFITSDFYLGRDFIQRLLEKNGYTGYEDIIVSCDYNMSKKKGNLYDVLLKRSGKNSNIVHIGDNQISDVKNAELYNISTFYYKNVNECGNKYRATDMSPVFGSAYRGVVNARIHNGCNKLDEHYEYGYIYGGLFVLGYCAYIHELFLNLKLDKVLFIARDGYLIREVYNKLYGSEANDYCFWSRVAGLKVCAQTAKNEFFKEYLFRYSEDGQHIRIKDIFVNMDISNIVDDFFTNTHIMDEEYLTVENVDRVHIYLESKWNKIIELYESKRIAAEKYLKDITKNCKRIAVVDVGWRGNAAISIRRILSRDQIDVIGIVAGSAPTLSNSEQLTEKIIYPYLFSPINNYSNFWFHKKNSINNVLFEILLGAKHPSLKDFGLDKDETYELIFEPPEVKNYKIIEKVHAGCKQFVEDYTNCFKEYEFMYAVDAHDAYMPIKHIFKNYAYLKRFFSQYEFQDVVGVSNVYKKRYISDVFEKFNL